LQADLNQFTYVVRFHAFIFTTVRWLCYLLQSISTVLSINFWCGKP